MFLDKLTSIFCYPVSAERRLALARRETEKITIAEEELEKQRILALHKRYSGVEERGVSSQPFSDEEVIDLSVARTNKKIWDRPATSLFITDFYADMDNTLIRFNNPAAPQYRVNTGWIKGRFDSIYLSNTAQAAGKKLKFVVGFDELNHYEIHEISPHLMYVVANTSMGYLEHLKLNLPRASCTPTMQNVTLTLADTEYSQAITNETKIIRANLTNLATFRFAWVAGKVAAPTAPYGVQVANRPLEYDKIFCSSLILYFADSVGGQVMQIESWK